MHDTLVFVTVNLASHVAEIPPVLPVVVKLERYIELRTKSGGIGFSFGVPKRLYRGNNISIINNVRPRRS